MVHSVYACVTQLFKYFDFSQSLNVMTMAINRATRDIIAFAIMFFTIFLAFVQFGYLIFGTYMQDFSTYSDSMYATFQHVIIKNTS